MSSVVFRCPACGTTQSHAGECETCFDGTVRYFCGNHEPGRWLDEPVCNACGARFGEAPPRPASPMRGPARPSRETHGPDLSRSTRPRAERSPTSVRRAPPRMVEREDASEGPSLGDLLAHVARGRERAPYEPEEIEVREPAAEAPRKSILLGCLLRIVLLVILLIALALFALFALLGGG